MNKPSCPPGAFAPAFSARAGFFPRLLCASVLLSPAAALAAPLSFLGNQVPMWLPLVLTVGLIALGVYSAILKHQQRRTGIEYDEHIARQTKDRNQALQQVRALTAETAARAKQLSQLQNTAELLRQENSDLQAMVNHRLRQPIETLSNALERALHDNGLASGSQLRDALQQLQSMRESLKQIQRISQSDTFDLQVPPQHAAPVATELAVLLVENSARDSIAQTLEKLGQKVQRENNGIDGAAAALQKKFDLVLLDGELSMMSSAETVAKIRANADRDLPIFVLLSGVRPEDKQKYLSRGFTGILPRPVREIHLQKLLDWTARRQRKSPTMPSGGKIRPPRLLNTSTLLQKRDTLGHQAFAEFLNLRCTNLPKRVTELTSQLTGRHWLDAEELAVSIGNSAAEVGLETVAATLRDLAARLSIDDEREYCRHQRTELLNLMRASMQQLSEWREQNVYTEWALK